jgi:hypothetical protein
MRRLALDIHVDGAGCTRNWKRIQAAHLNSDKTDANQIPNTEEIIKIKKNA